MAVNKVDLYVSQILEDLDNGLTWLKRDDVGYGSIQEKYNAKDQQITMIRKHPKLKDAETNVTVFNIIDDTKENEGTIPVGAANGLLTTESGTVHGTTAYTALNTSENSTPTTVAEDFSAFVNL